MEEMNRSRQAEEKRTVHVPFADDREQVQQPCWLVKIFPSFFLVFYFPENGAPVNFQLF